MGVSRIWLVLLLILAWPSQASLLTKEEAAWLEQHPVIRFAPDPSYPPVEFFNEDGQYQGITADFMHIIEQRIGIKLQVIRMENWNRVISAAEARQIDVLGAVDSTPERQRFMNFSRPYINLPAVIIVRKEVSGGVALDDLVGKTVVVIKNYKTTDYLRERLPQLNTIEVPDAVSGLRLVSFGVADAIVVNNAVSIYYIEKEGLTNLRAAGESGFEWKLHFAARNDHPELVSILQKGLDSISEEEKREIYRRWINLDYPDWLLSRDTLYQLGSLLAVLLALLGVLWNVTLQQKVRRKTKALEQELEARCEMEQRLRQLATTDELTGVYNRRHLLQTLDAELERQRRYGNRFSVLMLDVDHFKLINDSYGHAGGDQALKQIAEITQTQLREGDHFGRMGGEEFVILLCEADAGTAEKVAERIRAAIEGSPIRLSTGQQVEVTVSIGLSFADPLMQADDLLHEADQAMYEAKSAGRNRIRVARNLLIASELKSQFQIL